MFLWVEPLVGTREAHITAQRTSRDFAEQLRGLSDEVYPHAERIVSVLDNRNTHTAVTLYERSAPAEARRLASRFGQHHTPEHGSCLSMAARELPALSRQCLARCLANLEDVTREAAAWRARRGQRGTMSTAAPWDPPAAA